MSDSVKFSFNVAEGSLELEGPEDFVTKTLEDMKPFLSEVAEIKKAAITTTPVTPAPVAPSTPVQPSPSGGNSEQPPSAPKSPISETGIEAYPHTFSELDGTLHIVANIPGDSTKQKMTNVGLLYSFGSELMGESTSQSESIRNVVVN